MNNEILDLTIKFHDTYERLAKEYNYTTREDTKRFNIKSDNGKLMYATVSEVVRPILYENQKYKEMIDKAIKYIETHKRKDEFLELNEWETRDLLNILKEVE